MAPSGNDTNTMADLPVNHEEALQLAHMRRDESNLARCYIALRAITDRASSMPLVSDETRPAVEIARQMLAMGINVQATGEVTNQVVAGIIKSLLDHIDELEADLKCAVAVGRYAARAPSPQGTDQPTLPMAPEPVRKFAEAILHGDGVHRAWLLDAAEAFINGKPIPSVRDQTTVTSGDPRGGEVT
jgi:hypothetical protein